jgi:hypothetical protein
MGSLPTQHRIPVRVAHIRPQPEPVTELLDFPRLRPVVRQLVPQVDGFVGMAVVPRDPDANRHTATIAPGLAKNGACGHSVQVNFPVLAVAVRRLPGHVLLDPPSCAKLRKRATATRSPG